MKFDIMLQDRDRKQALKDLKKAINRSKKWGIDDATALQALKEDYSDVLSDEEIYQLMNEAK
ncbi:MAG: hypothetical protein ACI4T3_03520 [Lactobacillus sp.]